ncbi:DNA methyltransferase [Paracoccaceae bacterium Fryx2]|nr:DNA methyltransferase [Paracoccaceae bacterium Fryx2]
MDLQSFIARWQASGGSERANFQQFAIELTQVLGVDAPKPATADGQTDDYRFERPITFIHTSQQSRGFIDLYRRAAFVMEAKQGTGKGRDPDDAQFSLLPDEAVVKRQGHGQRGSRRWDDTMLRARNQADGYARAVARSDGWPPFLMVVDVGHVIEVYADFSGQGQGYTQFPDGSRYRIQLTDLHDEKVRDRLRTIWLDPHALDPAKVSAQVTRKVAGHLAELGKSFEGQGHAPEAVARFLMRCLFTMFAEDVLLIPEKAFSTLLKKLRGQPENAAPALQSLWQTMDGGGFSGVLMTHLKRFNGGLFKESTALPLTAPQLSLLIAASEHDWREVEPAIFGTLLERALDKRQRHKLGAHYTPRAYVERLVMPTVIEPLRADWLVVQASVQRLAQDGKLEEARATVRTFHRQLCEIRVLDPACGSGNFLYVALEMMKRLEGEVTALLADLGEDQAALSLAGHTVDPHQFLGIELNPWAAAVAELVLWIGYLQWHFRTHGTASPAEPVLRDFKNIENRDAVLDWDSRRERRDDAGKPVTRWDGIGTVEHPATGERVPDPQARVQVWDYLKPRPAKWPQADFIVGNPPFIGTSRMREALGDGYAEALRAVYPKVPESADFVMYWWEKAALATRAGKLRRFGLITTNSLRQTFNRRVLEPHLNDPKTPLSLLFAIADHPWVDAGDGAAVRIAMTVAAPGALSGRLVTVTEERKGETEAEGRPVTLSTEKGRIFANLRIGADIGRVVALKANERISSAGVKLHGSGFIITPAEARALGLGTVPGLDRHIRQYRNGRDLTARSRNVMVIDLFGLSEIDVQARFPAVYQHLLDKVKPDRDQNNRDSYKRLWWVHGEPRSDLRPALAGLPRYIATVETMQHRVFMFLPNEILPDNRLIIFASDDASLLSILSSQFHVTWSLAVGGVLEDRPVYNSTVCYNPFPFPEATEAQKTRLRHLGEQLDAHRRSQQAAHPKLTLTGIYNVLEKLRAGQRIEGKDHEVYEQGLVGILKKLHDDIDAEVAAAYGWPVDLSEDDLLQRLVDLNRERAKEEAQGLVRWLRPEYQNPAGKAAEVKGEQAAFDIGPIAVTKQPWPKTLPEQMAAVRAALAELGDATPDQIARHFARVQTRSVEPLLASLEAIGQAAVVDGRYFM